MSLNQESQRTDPVNPAKVLVYGFAAVIVVGTILLMLPISSASGRGAAFLTALFTSTSAVCVTGLIVVDTGYHWSIFGQAVILGLIQVGGLGIMTMSTTIALFLGRKVSLRERLIIREATGQLTMEGLIRLVHLILKTTLVFEGVGALLLTIRWAQDYPLARAAWLGVFHSVSAFNNAGFDIFSVSLTGYVEDPVTNIVVITLIVFGGIGFAVIAEIYRRLYHNERRISLHTKVVVTVSLVLIITGACLVFIMEAGNPETLGELSPTGKILASVFTAITPRTAGFNTVSTGHLRFGTLFLVVLLMFIGGSPGSTAGGVKTTTFFALFAAVLTTIRGRADVEAFRRRIDVDIVYQSLTIVTLGMLVVFIVTFTLLVTEGATLVDALFEATSAFGTVGLSTGITPELSSVGRAVIIVTMFIGRLGPLTLALALGQTTHHRGIIRYPRESMMIG